VALKIKILVFYNAPSVTQILAISRILDFLILHAVKNTKIKKKKSKFDPGNAQGQ
jgi:hypothetical protein